MSCYSPRYALNCGLDPSTGKKHIKFLPQRVGEDFNVLSNRYGKDLITIPCGKCLSCKIARSKSWALRCVLEASEYTDNYFVTLTYSPEFCPDKLCKDDLQKFIRSVHDRYGWNVRYFACGEYGGLTKRPHYHIIFFNLKLDDIRGYTKGRFGGYYMKSQALQKLWNKGHIEIGDCSYESCAYVARYTTKKFNQNQDEFIIMSKRPGLGFDYYLKHYKDFYQVDRIVAPGVSGSIPRYFDKLLETVNPSMLEELKANRISNANLKMADYILQHSLKYQEYVAVKKEELLKEKAKALKRSL
ncbi:replication initiator protein [Capybara microvirus Cap3_SP_468]|nr:replication initiator protein [Capybara microvirus Cap3_SP_468]